VEKKLIYDNPLSGPDSVSGFCMEGKAQVTFPNGKMRMANLLDPGIGQAANFVFWCGRAFPASIEAEWDFCPISEPGLAMLFFSAAGQNGEDLYSPTLAPRFGEYKSYHSGDINAYHVSYFRRKAPIERAFHTCNLRKSSGFHMVAQGADPLPDAHDSLPPYHIRLVKDKNHIRFFINQLPLFEYIDDGITYGKVLEGGKIGFRQMAPLVAEYANFKVYELI